MTLLITRLLVDEEAQDLVEYTLLMAFVLFTVVGLFLGIRDGVTGITSVSTSQITAANAFVH